MFRVAALLAFFLVFGMRPAAAQPTELPIHEMVRRKGNGPARPIFSMPVRVGSTLIETGIDTGSIGMRVLPETLKPGDAQAEDQPDTYGYASGVRLDGKVGTADLAFGARHGPGRLQLVETVGCFANALDCPAEQVGSQANYGLMGQGIAHAGFRAIAGLRLAPPQTGKPGNPLIEVGAKRWIIDLPRRGEGPGRLMIDPPSQNLAGFVELPPASAAFGERAPANTVPGCLVAPGGERREICGSILFDTGAPGIRVTLPQGRIEDWPLGLPARLILGDGHGHALAMEDFMAGPVHHGHVGGAPPRPDLARPAISVGVTPFLGFSVLYDADRQSVAVRPRPDAPDAPRASVSAR